MRVLASRPVRRLLAFALALPLGLALPSGEAHACDDESRLCVDSDNAKWEPDASLSQKSLKRERKKNKKKPPSNLYLTVADGRASVFIDGRFVNTAPLESYELGAGKHDIQIRDGDIILAEGVLKIPKSSQSVRITVKHPGPDL